MKKGFRIINFKKNKPIFELKDVSKSFDGRPILKKISMKMHPGEIVGLLGPNGSGKSTLYNIIIGQHMADKGKVIINNKDISEIPIHERTKQGLGYLSQQRSVFNMSVYNNLLGICQLTLKNADEQRRMTEKLLDEFNLQHLRTLNSNVLSGGEVRRLMMARIMINKPKVILLDEPMAGMNVEEKREMCRFILKVNDEIGTTMVLIEHDMGVVMDISDRVVVLDYGKVIGDGTPDEVRSNQRVIDAYLGVEH